MAWNCPNPSGGRLPSSDTGTSRPESRPRAASSCTQCELAEVFDHSTTTAVALSEHHHRSVPWAFNRKEAKDHGEGGVLVGAPLQGRVLIVDDVITAGTAVRESLRIIRDAGAQPAGVLVALDRQERGGGDLSATQELTAEHGVPVVAIVGLSDVMEFAGGHPDLAGQRERMAAYRARYGV